MLLPATAAAKGPSEAKVTGPGLSSPLTISGNGESDTSTDLGLLVSETGFFPQAFGQSPSSMLQAIPQALGPRYLVTYTVPGSSTDLLVQDLYPYATGGPVSYMAPGQKFWGNQSTPGGWYRGTQGTRLKGMLVKAGLPATAPPAHDLAAAAASALLRHRR